MNNLKRDTRNNWNNLNSKHIDMIHVILFILIYLKFYEYFSYNAVVNAQKGTKFQTSLSEHQTPKRSFSNKSFDGVEHSSLLKRSPE